MLVGVARAAPLQLVYDGYLSPGDTMGGVALTSFTPFEVRAAFDSCAPIARIEPGAAAYAPSAFTLTLKGTTYDVTRVQDDPVHGQTVVIFDKTAPDANSPAYRGVSHYGVGFFSLGSGNVGVIGDWTAASPEVALGNLASTTFNQFYGVGYNDGPIGLTANEVMTVLQLNDPADYNGSDPSLIFYGSNVGALTIADNQAALQDVPEPASATLLAALLSMLGLLGLRRQRRG
jgi:hypothetical protein